MIGIYAIRNEVTGQQYVGRSVNTRERLYGHFWALRHGRHCNRLLQESFRKYGEAAFTGRTIIICRRDDLVLYEYLAIAALHTDESSKGFNLTPAENGILSHGPEAKAAISAALRKRKPYMRTPEIREKIAKSLKGRSGVNRGRKFSPEWRAKLSAAKRGTKMRLGKTFTPEQREKIARGVRAYARNRRLNHQQLHLPLDG
jgi:group I intron endonuclease